MADNQKEIESSARQIVELLTNPNFTTSNDSRLQKQTEALQRIAKGNKDSISSILQDVLIEAPLTFNKLWPSTFQAIQSYGNNPTGAIQRLGLLLGWAYIETVWNSQVTGRTTIELSGPDFAEIAAMQMGLPENVNEKDVLTAVFTHSTLNSTLLLNRFEQSVKGGLEQINGMETRLSGWEQRLNATEDRTNKAEAKISAYNKTLEEYEVAFGFLGMAAAYKKFFERKTTERNWFGGALAVLFIVILIMPVAGYHFANATGQSMLEQLEKYIPFAVLIFLLIYFFRVVLLHFNSTQAQLLQLEIKMAALAFIQEYVTFLKQNESPDLSKFESLVFGGIVADLDKVPSTFDGLEQLVKTVMQLKGEKS
ncbi:MAG: hypothetical protein WCE58_04350 [Gallionella sp.]